MQEVFDMVMAEPKKYQNLMCTHGTDERASKSIRSVTLEKIKLIYVWNKKIYQKLNP